MSCQSCQTINPLPSCLASGYSILDITNLDFPGHTNEPIVCVITNTATQKKYFIDLQAGDPIDISPIYPTMNGHYYKMEFFHEGAPANVKITHGGGHTGDGSHCCLEFTTVEGWVAESTTYEVSTDGCHGTE